MMQSICDGFQNCAARDSVCIVKGNSRIITAQPPKLSPTKQCMQPWCVTQTLSRKERTGGVDEGQTAPPTPCHSVEFTKVKFGTW